MVRRKRDEASPAQEGGDAQPANAETGIAEGVEPQATLTVKGGLSKVRRQLGPAASAQKPVEAKESESKESLRTAVVNALRDPKNRYEVKRQTPKRFGPLDISRVVLRDDCPITFSDLEEEIFQSHGGKRYRISVHDRDTGTTVAADTVERDLTPILEESSEEDTRSEDLIQPTPEMQSLQQINDQINNVTAMARLEGAKKQLAEIRGDSDSKSKPQQEDPRVSALEKTIERLEYESREEKREARHQKELAELRAQIAAGAPKTGQSDIQILVAQMAEDRKQSQSQFNALLNKIQDDKMAALQQSIDRIGSKGASSGVKEMVDTFTMMAGALGIKLPNLRGHDDDDDEPMEWWEKLADKAPEMIDKISAIFTKAKGEGRSVSRDEVLALAKQAEDDAVKAGIARIKSQAPAAPPALQAPAPPQVNPLTAPPPPSAMLPTAIKGEVKVPVLPPPPPQAGAEGGTGAVSPLTLLPPLAPEGGETPKAAEMSQVDQQVLVRVTGVLDIFMAEVDLRPKMPEWTAEAWQTLPEDILEKVCACETGDAFCDVIATIPHLQAAPLKILRDKVNSTPRTQGFVKRCLDEMRGWWAKSLADPSFDPCADEEEEEETA